MARKQQEEPAGGGADWLTTYCDLVTLLMTFFVLLFAISQVDVQKFNILASALSNKGAPPEKIMAIAAEQNLKLSEQFDPNNPLMPLAPEDAEASAAAGEGGEGDGVDTAATLEHAYNLLDEYISQSDARNKISVANGNGYIFIRFMDDLLFEPNSARIRSQDYELLSFVGQGLKNIQDSAGLIRIDGHTATVLEDEAYPVSDRVLSSERANSVLMYFEDVVGIDGEKLAAFSFGKQRPIADNDTPAGRAKNRRIEILVTEDSNIDIELDNIYEKMVA